MLLPLNTWWVLLGTSLLGLACGALGTFVFLRRRGLMGDVLAHATLPGVCIAFLVVGSKATFPTLIGALLAALAAAWCIYWLPRHTPLHGDCVLAIVLSIFFSTGIVMLTGLQTTAAGQQSGLDTFLFGQAAAISLSDLKVLAVLVAFLLTLLLLARKELKLLCFDPAFAQSLGFSTSKLDGLLLFLTSLAVTLGLQAVGSILVAALLVIPAATAHRWTVSLTSMGWLAAALGLFAAVVGTLTSLLDPELDLPTGPFIVLTASCCFVLTFFLAPRTGVLARNWRKRRLRNRLARESVWSSIQESYALHQATSWAWDELQSAHPSLGPHVRYWQRKGLLVTAKQGQTLQIRLTHQGHDCLQAGKKPGRTAP